MGTWGRDIYGFPKRRNLALAVEVKASKRTLRRKDLRNAPRRPVEAGKPDRSPADMRAPEGLVGVMFAEIKGREMDEG